MSKLSFNDLVKTLKEKYKYKFDVFTLNNLGDYSPEDSDWNYKDVPHLNIVHQNVDSVQAYISDNVAGAINTQKIPFFGFKFPMTLLNYEYQKHDQVYLSTLGPFLIIVNTISSEENGKTLVKTTYAIGSRGLFRFLHWLIKKAIKKNYKVLMSEDTPMRNRKGHLRSHSHDFYKPDETYSFKFTEEIYRANTYIKSVKSPKISLKINEIYCCKEDDVIGEKDGLMSFFTTKENEKVKLWPRTCPHEGAKMSKNCIKRERLLCP